MAEVEQKGLFGSRHIQAVIKFSQTFVIKFEAGFGRFENFGRRLQAGQMYKNIADETDIHSRSNQDPP